MRPSKKTVSSALLLLSFLALALFARELVLPKPYHEEHLDAILTLESKGKRPESKEAMQLRHNGKKELYRAAEGSHLRNRTELQYKTSILTLDKGVSKNSLNEKMKDVLLTYEEEGVYTIMEAENAAVIFDTGEIIAENVFLKKSKAFETSFGSSHIDSFGQERSSAAFRSSAIADAIPSSRNTASDHSRLDESICEDPNEVSLEGVFFWGSAKKVRGSMTLKNMGFIAEEFKGRFKEE